MLFNSYIFIFIFLPVTLTVYYLIGSRGQHRIAISWLVAASLFYYGWWNPAYLGLILTSMLFNYAMGVYLGSASNLQGRSMLLLGIAANLTLLGYYKYAGFFIENVNSLFSLGYNMEKIILPLAISFFTFQQIAYLVDAHRGEAKEYNFLHYSLFVTFFPQLIAGPIVHHKEMMPQFAKSSVYRFSHENFSVGMTIFILGLFKKVVIADNVSLYAVPVFNAVDQGVTVTFFEAWCGALGYTLRLYFDFSGYSDMAIGLGRMFGIRLPVNFYSPYKALNIIDFWHRWHMTLSRFLRDYLYFSLGGNRKGPVRRYINLMIVMVFGGLWHGAGWTFVFWGGLHGFYLVINHSWHAVKGVVWGERSNPSNLGKSLSWLITFISVTIGWVFFRSTSMDSAISILASMSGLNGISLEPSLQSGFIHVGGILPQNLIVYKGMFYNDLGPLEAGFKVILLLIVIVWFMPNTLQIMYDYTPVVDFKNVVTRWKNKELWNIGGIKYAFLLAFIASVAILSMSRISEFLYFQF